MTIELINKKKSIKIKKKIKFMPGTTFEPIEIPGENIGPISKTFHMKKKITPKEYKRGIKIKIARLRNGSHR